MENRKSDLNCINDNKKLCATKKQDQDQTEDIDPDVITPSTDIGAFRVEPEVVTDDPGPKRK